MRARPGLLALGLLVTMLTAGCGSADNATAAKPGPKPSSDTAPQAIQIHYTTLPTPGMETEEYRVETDVIARGDQSRTRMSWYVDNGPPDEDFVMVLDGNRALVHSVPPRNQYQVMEAADEHPDDLLLESRPLKPGSYAFRQMCPDASLKASSRTILGREAVGYTCVWDDPDQSMRQAPELWLDEATGMMLEYGRTKARKVTLDPEIDETTFSTKPPAGAKVEVVKATGKGPPVEDDEPEINPEDALVTISETSPIPVYYLGPEFEGVPLSEVFVFDDKSGSEVPGDLKVDPGQSLWILYGEDLQMGTEPFRPRNFRKAVDCYRVRPLRGVPTVEFGGSVVLFTADFVINIEALEGREDAAPVAAALYKILEGPTGADLPAPPARILPLIDKACGANPGEHGMLLEE